MTETELSALASWVANAGLMGTAETGLIEGFCGRAVAAGLPLARVIMFIDTLHPIHEGRVFRWERDKPIATVAEYGSSTEGEAAERWRASPHYRLLEMGESVMRRQVTGETKREFPLFPALWEGSVTEFVAMVNRFSSDGVIGEMDCFYTGWMTDREGGFSDVEVTTLERLTTFLGLAVKAVSLARIADTLVETYLGRDAGRRVLQGRIARGVADRIKTVLWFSDLRNYTRISDNAPPEEIIPLLNDYADGLHLGVVFYGNIGSKERLDFTVVGPAVNEVARIAAMCRSVDQPILLSSAFVASVAEERRHFASVGRFALRGVGKPQELYTLDAEGEGRPDKARQSRPVLS
jgi:adenylate cyclase